MEARTQQTKKFKTIERKIVVGLLVCFVRLKGKSELKSVVSIICVPEMTMGAEMDTKNGFR